MQILVIVIAVIYVVVMPILFINWLGFFRYDIDFLTGDEKQLSLAVIAIATLLWPLVLPFAYIELLDKFKRSTRAARLYQKILETPRTHHPSESEIHLSN